MEKWERRDKKKNKKREMKKSGDSTKLLQNIIIKKAKQKK